MGSPPTPTPCTTELSVPAHFQYKVQGCHSAKHTYHLINAVFSSYRNGGQVCKQNYSVSDRPTQIGILAKTWI